MDHKRNYKNPCKSSPRNFASFPLSAVYAAVHTFFGKAALLESTKYVLDERPKRMASRLIQLSDEFDKELKHLDVLDERPKRMASRLIQLSDEFDKELTPDDHCTCHILSYLLLLVRWLICY